MTDDDQVLEDVLAELRSLFGASVQVLENDESILTLQIGPKTSGVIRLRVKDAARPSFAVSYPALKVKRNGRRQVEPVEADGVLFEGIRWIVGQIAQHGVVRPEFE